MFFATQDKERMAYEWLEGGYKEEQVGVQDYKNILFLVCVQSVVKVFFFFLLPLALGAFQIF